MGVDEDKEKDPPTFPPPSDPPGRQPAPPTTPGLNNLKRDHLREVPFRWRGFRSLLAFRVPGRNAEPPPFMGSGRDPTQNLEHNNPPFTAPASVFPENYLEAE